MIWATGKIDGALSFDGGDDYVVTDVTTGLDFSVSTKTSCNYAHNIGLNGNSWLFWIDQGELRFELQNGSTNPFSVPSDWTYLTGVFESLDSLFRVESFKVPKSFSTDTTIRYLWRC